MNGLSENLIAQLKARAQDPARRSDVDEMFASSATVDELLVQIRAPIDRLSPAQRKRVREYTQGINTDARIKSTMMDSMFGSGALAKGLFAAAAAMAGGKPMFGSIGGTTFSMGPKREPSPAPPPAGEEQVAAAEAELGFPLPPPLRQYYLEVADGGLGPGDGLYSLNEMLAKWREMTREPVGPRGQKWPAKLLPIEGERWDLTCIDRDGGAIVYFDVEEVDYGGWKKCFREEAESLEAWLGKWLARPSAAEKAALRAQRPPPKQLTDEDWEVWAAESPENREYMRRLDIATMTPEQRAAIGLTEDNWAEKMWEGLDLGKIKPPTPGYAERWRAKGQAEEGR